jgi:hypothetical protein
MFSNRRLLCFSLRRQRARIRPQIEVLEDRLAPAGFVDDPASFVVVPEAPVLSRLARFVPNATPSVSNWVSVAGGDSNLDPKTNGGDTNIYVIAHGWAPGFKDMVNDNGTATNPLKWWQTLDTSLMGSPGAPASPEMFYSSIGDGIQISPSGLAYAITQADPKAVVLAYSWIDESATDQLLSTIPEDAFLSEAYTAMNGQRLANALEQALPSNFNAHGGNLHLIGHSHGSKVATVATLALDNTGTADYHVAQLTILDSPEDGSYLVRQSDSANNLWFFLGGLQINHTNPSSTQTFVDHYISEFDTLDGVIQGVDPFNTNQTTSSLQQIVDVNLNGRVLFYATNFGDLHAYAFNWYAGGSQAWTQNPKPTVADQWSPFVKAGNLPTAGSYKQTWTKTTQPQFQLTAGNTKNTVSVTPAFSKLSFDGTPVTDGATYNSTTGNIVLTEDGSFTASFDGKFAPETGLNGISFQYQFTNVGQGDQLVISVDTLFGYKYKIYYVMTGTVAGTTTGVGTLSLPSFAGAYVDHHLQIQLMPLSGSKGASVTISHLQQFATTLGGKALLDAPLQDTSSFRFVSLRGLNTGQVVVANFIDGNPFAQMLDYHVVINWGDGTSSPGTVSLVSRTPSGSNWQVVGSHTYAKRTSLWRPHVVTVTMADLEGQTIQTHKTWFFNFGI